MQVDVFWQSEGDEWYLRNRDNLTVERASRDFPMQLLEKNGLSPKRALDIGCANGYQLEAIRQKYGATCHGIDASALAITAGQRAYPGVRLERACADQAFWVNQDVNDLIIESFVFHWLDRGAIWLMADEINETLCDGGYLLLADFLPDYPYKRPYKHKEGVWTYKMDYGAFFVASGLYREVDRIVIDHDRHVVDPNAASDVRACYWLLQKGDYYRCE